MDLLGQSVGFPSKVTAYWSNGLHKSLLDGHFLLFCNPYILKVNTVIALINESDLYPIFCIKIKKWHLKERSFIPDSYFLAIQVEAHQDLVPS